MAQYEDKVLHELDGIKEYDNPMPGWLMAIWWGALIFSAAYLIFYALSFGEGSMEAEYRADTERSHPAVQAHFDANPLVPPQTAELLAGARDPAVLAVGGGRFTRSCAACHGSSWGVIARKTPITPIVFSIEAEPAGTPDRNPEAFSLLGLQKNIRIYLDPSGQLPIRVSGRNSLWGELILDLGEVRLY